MTRYILVLLNTLFIGWTYAQKSINAYDFLNSLSVEKIDLYKLNNASAEKKICRKLLAQYHPDKNRDKTQGEQERASAIYIDIGNACAALDKALDKRLCFFESYTADPNYVSKLKSKPSHSPIQTPYAKPKAVTLDEALRQAVEHVDEVEVLRLLVRGAKPDATRDILHRAVRSSKGFGPSVIRALLDYGARVNSRDNSGQTPLDVALDYENLEAAEVLMQMGGIVNNFDIDKQHASQNNNSLLHNMVILDKKSWVKVLIKLGANVNLANKLGSTPLHDVQSVEVAQMLTSAGADLYAQTKSGKTPLDIIKNKAILAVLQRYDNSPANKLIILIKTDKLQEIKDFIETTTVELNKPTKSGKLFIYYAESRDVLELLIKLGASLNVVDKSGRTVLDHALFDKNLHKARMLLNLPTFFFFSNLARKEYDWGLVKKFMTSEMRYNAKAVAFNFEHDNAIEGNSWLFRAALDDDCSWIEVLLKAGANPNVQNALGRTPLHVVSSTIAAELLIDAGADLDIVDSVGRMPLDAARTADLRDLLVRAGTATTLHGVSITLAHFLEKDAIYEVKKLLETYSVELNKPDRKGSLLLSYASSSEAIEALLAAGADINARDSKGLTALDNALTEKDLKKARALLGIPGNSFVVKFAADKARGHGAKTAQVNLETYNNKHSNTWLHQAVLANDSAWVEVLIRAGAQVNTQNIFKSTPLHDVQSLEVAHMLIDAGADVSAVSEAGEYPYESVKNKEIRELLLEKSIPVLPHGPEIGLAYALENDNGAQANAILARYKLDLNKPDNECNVPFAYVKSPAMLEFLIASGADINAHDCSGKTALDRALIDQNIEAACLLLGITKLSLLDRINIFKWYWYSHHQKGYGARTQAVDLEQLYKNDNGNSWLHRAVQADDISWIKVLIASGANVNSKNDSNKTPLHDVQSVKAAQLLIRAGADLYARSDSGNTPLDDARTSAIRSALMQADAEVQKHAQKKLKSEL